MEDVIAIIVTIIIGIAAKWLEDRHKNKDKRKSSEGQADRRGKRHIYNSAPHTAPVKAYKAEPKPQPSPVPVPLFEEGQCAVSHEEPSDEISSVDTTATDEELAAHYARWSQAIIDAQIITPKFKD